MPSNYFRDLSGMRLPDYFGHRAFSRFKTAKVPVEGCFATLFSISLAVSDGRFHARPTSYAGASV